MQVTICIKVRMMAKLFGRSALKTEFPDYTDFSTVDGVQLAIKQDWLLVRASGTEPLIRLTVEGESLAAANDITEKATAVIRKEVEAEMK